MTEICLRVPQLHILSRVWRGASAAGSSDPAEDGIYREKPKLSCTQRDAQRLFLECQLAAAAALGGLLRAPHLPVAALRGPRYLRDLIQRDGHLPGVLLQEAADHQQRLHRQRLCGRPQRVRPVDAPGGRAGAAATQLLFPALGRVPPAPRGAPGPRPHRLAGLPPAGGLQQVRAHHQAAQRLPGPLPAPAHGLHDRALLGPGPAAAAAAARPLDAGLGPAAAPPAAGRRLPLHRAAAGAGRAGPDGAAAALLPRHRAPGAGQRQAGQRPQLPPPAPAALPRRPAAAPPRPAPPQQRLGAAALLRLPAGHPAAGLGQPARLLPAPGAGGAAGGQLAAALLALGAQPAALHVAQRGVPTGGALRPAPRRGLGRPATPRGRRRRPRHRRPALPAAAAAPGHGVRSPRRAALSAPGPRGARRGQPRRLRAPPAPLAACCPPHAPQPPERGSGPEPPPSSSSGFNVWPGLAVSLFFLLL